MIHNKIQCRMVSSRGISAIIVMHIDTNINDSSHKIALIQRITMTLITIAIGVALTSVMGMQSAKKGPKGCNIVGLRKILIPGCTNPTSTNESIHPDNPIQHDLIKRSTTQID